jgi:hypothetical protein
VQKNLSGSVFSEDSELVDTYFRRKFKRIAKQVGELTVWDEGMTHEEGLLFIQKGENGSVYASVSVGAAAAFVENADGTISTSGYYPPNKFQAPGPGSTTSMYPNMNVGYTPPTYKEQPNLTEYPQIFEAVAFPKELHDYGGGKEGCFKAKFYDVFPREK